MEILLYITVAFLLLRFAVVFVNSITSTKLEPAWTDDKEQISILIPARNEEANLGELLSDIYAQDYCNYEVIILDDFSADNTGLIAMEFAKAHPSFRLIKGSELPEGWLGKSWACHQLAQEAKGKYFLFLDADVRIKGFLLSSALEKMKRSQLALLSLFPRQEMMSTGEWLVVPIMHYLLLSLLPLKLIELFKHPSLAAANGQFMLFKAEEYRLYQWHGKVKNEVTEDIEIMKEVKRSGYRGATLLENNFIRCRMYHSLKEGVHGFSKNLLPGFGGSIVGLLLFLYLTEFSYVLFLCTADWQLFIWCCFIVILLRSMISAISGQNPLFNVVLHIPQMMVMIYISILSIIGKFRKTIVWKGRKIHR